MKSHQQQSIYTTLCRIFLLAGTFMLSGIGRSWGQTYANTQTSGTYGCGVLGCSTTAVTNPANAVSVSLLDSATLKSVDAVLGTTGGNAQITLTFPSNLPSGATTYIKIGTPTNTNLVLGLLGVLGLVGSNIYVDAINSASSVSTSSSNSVTIIKNAAGEQFLYVKPPTAFGNYNALKIRVEAPTGLVSSVSLHVYYAVYDTTTTSCTQQPIYTNLGATSGVSVSLSTAVASPELAIDASTATASVLTTGAVAVGATTSQTIYFNGLSNSTDEVRVLLSIPPSLLSLTLFSNINIQTYNGTTSTSTVQSVSNSLIGLNLLTLFGSNAIIPVYFKTTSPFDRVVISLGSFVAVTAPSVNVYDVKRVPGPPTFSTLNSDTAYVCSGSSKSISADAVAGSSFNWYASSSETVTTPFFTGNPYQTSNLTNDTVFYVARKNTNCSQESERVPVRVVVRALPTINIVTPLYQCIQQPTYSLVYNSATNSPTFYSITWSGTAITQSFPNVNDVNLPSSPIPVVTPITAPAGAYSATLSVRNTNMCSTTYPITITIVPLPSPPSTSFQ